MDEIRYVRDDFDKKEYARLVKEAKGEGRTMQQFAADIEVKPSTLSRIVNLKNNTASADRLLVTIAQNADPESGVTLEQLRKANGLKGGSNISSAMASEFERHSFKVIENALETHAGVYIKKKEVEPPVSKHYRTDFVFETEPYGRWAFECKCVMTPMGSGSWYRSLMTMVGILYSADDLDKLSFVFQRRAFQEQMKRLLDELNIKKEISTLLIEGNEIVEEYCTGHRYGLWRKEDEA